MLRALYSLILSLHPAPFRARFASEMLWIFDQSAGLREQFSYLADAFTSLARQRLLRSGLWMWAAAAIAGLVPLLLAFGSFLSWDKFQAR